MKNDIDTQLESELMEFADATELDGLMDMAGKLISLAQPALTQASQEATWGNLSHQQTGVDRVQIWKAWGLIGVPALMAIAIGVVVLAQGAAPATPLYSIKRLSENVQLVATFSSESKAQLCALYMKRRAHELAALPAGQSPAMVAALTNDVTAEAIEYVQYADQTGADEARVYSRLRQDALEVMVSLETAKRNQSGAAQTTSINAALKYMAGLAHPAV